MVDGHFLPCVDFVYNTGKSQVLTHEQGLFAKMISLMAFGPEKSILPLIPAVRKLVNCADLPKPKKLKDKAKLRFCGGDFLRGHLRKKFSLALTGKQAVYGFNSGLYAPTAFASNEHNEKQALYARVLANTIEPSTLLLDCIQWAKTNHKALFKKMWDVQSVPFDVYLRRSNASPSVKRVLQIAHDKLCKLGIDENSHLSKSQLYQMTYRSSFVKIENDSYTSPLGRKDKAPRLIQGATPEFICLVGPWIMALQDLLKRRWNVKNNLCFTSGLHADACAKYISDGVGEYLEDDLGKFDCSIRRPWCEYEVWLAKRFGAPCAVIDLMTANINTHGSTLHGWRYKCDGTRKSGDPYTSLMNSVINGISHLFLYCKWTGHTVTQSQKTIKMLLQGDDNLMRHMEREHFPWREGMAELGFDSEALYRRNADTVEFCSMRLYPTDKGLMFGPKPGRVLSRLGYCVNPPMGVSRESMMRGIALGLKKNCNFVPPLRLVLERVLELTDGHKAVYQRGFQEHVIKVKGNYEPVSATWHQLYEQYFYSHTDHAWLSEEVSHIQLGDQYKTPIIYKLFDRDTSGPQRIFGTIGTLSLPIAA